MGIFGKRFGNILNIIFEGKPKTIKHDTEEQVKQSVELINKANRGDEESLQKVKNLFFVSENELKKKINPEIKNIKEIINQSKKVIESAEFNLKSADYVDVLKSNDNFEYKDEKFYLKGHLAELPMNIIQKFSELILKNESIEHLISFWQLNLLNENPEARRGLYKYLTKQKLIITQEGYFVTFRRIKNVTHKQVKEKQNIPQKIVDEFCVKAKRWKKSKRAFEVYLNSVTQTFELKDIKNHEKNSKINKCTFIGTLYDVYEGMLLDEIAEQKEQIFTDAHTGTMVIKLNKPVKMSRSKCNKDSNVECSYGLHVGTPTYVSEKSDLGDSIVACLVNPMHVISVPYKDAHKMRVCEYLPFKILTSSELLNFDKIDIQVYEIEYKKIEKEKLEKALSIIDNIKPEEVKEFTINKKVSTQDEINELILELENNKLLLEKKQKELISVLDDDVNSALNLDEIKNILKQRIKS